MAKRPTIGRTALVGLAVSSAMIAVPGVAQAAKSGNAPAAKACQKGGWEYLGTITGASFTSEKECTSYAAHGNTLTTLPYAAARTQCKSLNGTFSPADGAPVLWTCNGWPYASLQDFSDKGGSLFPMCTADGGHVFDALGTDGIATASCRV